VQGQVRDGALQQSQKLFAQLHCKQHIAENLRASLAHGPGNTLALNSSLQRNRLRIEEVIFSTKRHAVDRFVLKSNTRRDA
jgi:hypothetical protein